MTSKPRVRKDRVQASQPLFIPRNPTVERPSGTSTPTIPRTATGLSFRIDLSKGKKKSSDNTPADTEVSSTTNISPLNPAIVPNRLLPSTQSTAAAMSTSTLTGGFKMPVMDDIQKKMFNNDKLPKKGKTAPIFNIHNPSDIGEWLDTVTNVFDTCGVTDDKVKVAKCMEWSTRESRDVFCKWESVIQYDFVKFCKKLADTFPESLGDKKGSRRVLNGIVDSYSGIRPGEREKVRVYTEIFLAECKKLMEAPAIISNSDAVALYVSAFTPEMLTYVQGRLQTLVTTLTLNARRIEDPYLLAEVSEAAIGADAGASFQALYRTVGGGGQGSNVAVSNPHTFHRSPLAIPFLKDVPTSSKSAFEDPRVKHEDEREQKIALALDKQDAWFKEMTTVNRDIAEGMGSLKQLVQIVKESASGPNNKVGMSTGQIARFQGPTPVLGSQGKPMTPREIMCYMCNEKGHYMGACPQFIELVSKGWIVPDGDDGKKVLLKDGSRLPMQDNSETKYQKIVKYAKDKGWNSASSFFSVIEEEDYSDQLGASTSNAWMVIAQEVGALRARQSYDSDTMSVFSQNQTVSSKND